MKKLIIVTHPNLKASTINKTWLNELQKYPDDFEIHSIYDKYPDLNFDVASEQALIDRYIEIIFQFPLNWFSTPFALKKYLDEVFTFGWSFGPEGGLLRGKKIGFAISTGGSIDSYTAPLGIPIEDLLNHFKLSFIFCGCEISNIHTFYGAIYEPKQSDVLDNAKVYVNTLRMN